MLVGVASFLQKFSIRELGPYQIDFLMAMGMLGTAVPALWLRQGSLLVPKESLPLGAPIGLMMALGSISCVLALSKLPIGTAAAISTSYIVLVVFVVTDILGREPELDERRRNIINNCRSGLLSWEQK